MNEASQLVVMNSGKHQLNALFKELITFDTKVTQHDDRQTYDTFSYTTTQLHSSFVPISDA